MPIVLTDLKKPIPLMASWKARLVLILLIVFAVFVAVEVFRLGIREAKAEKARMIQSGR